MKANQEELIHKFFEEYESRFNKALAGQPVDVDGSVNAFAASFIEASPVGIIAGNNDAQFRKAIPQGYEFYKSIGTQSMVITNKEITPLDEGHTMVKVHWLSTYLTKENRKEEIEFDVFYFLQDTKEGLKIFAYITGDEQKVLKEKGLVK